MKIWNYSYPGLRVIRLEYIGGETSHAVTSQCCPALLHTCRKSREVALSWFKSAFNRTTEGLRLSPIIYLDPEIDTFYFERVYSPHEYPAEHLLTPFLYITTSFHLDAVYPVKQLAFSYLLFQRMYDISWHRFFFSKRTNGRQSVCPELKRIIVVFDKIDLTHHSAGLKLRDGKAKVPKAYHQDNGTRNLQSGMLTKLSRIAEKSVLLTICVNLTT